MIVSLRTLRTIIFVFLLWIIIFQSWEFTRDNDVIASNGSFLQAQKQSGMRSSKDSMDIFVHDEHNWLVRRKPMGKEHEDGTEVKPVNPKLSIDASANKGDAHAGIRSGMGDDRNKSLVNPRHGQQIESCECVNCKEDVLCGKLWNGTQVTGNIEGNNDIYKKEIHVVVSHCRTDLDLLTALKGFNVVSIHVISKCGHPVRGAPPDATIEVLPNVGRCDHSYAYYINNVLDKKLQLGTQDNNGENAIVAFLKDNAGARNLHQPGRWNSFYDMVQVASSSVGFSCGIVPGLWSLTQPTPEQKFLTSVHFELETLRNWEIVDYTSRNKYDSDIVPFESAFANWDLFYKNLGVGSSLEPELVQVCFGGVFVVSVKNIKKRKMGVWKAAEQSLSRGDNIQEGHYMERTWAMLLATPLEQYQVEAIKRYSEYTFRPGYGEGYKSEAFLGGLARWIKRCN
jgi:hypothetical protein